MKRHARNLPWIPTLLLAAALAGAGCSVNPATGERQLTLMSESQEIAMGKQSDEEIVATMGLYPDPAAQEYVQRLGSELAAKSERPDLPWTFRVIDDPIVNAFALPGGYIYLTRGILTHLNSEAEVASVLGHEIGHVTGRHSVERLSKAQLLSVGLGVGMVLSPEFRQLGDLAQTGLGILFLKFSRDDERQADDLGLRYATRGGYDAREMPQVFETLKRVSEVGGVGRIPSWLATHPDPEARQDRIRDQIAASGVSYQGTRVNRDPYLAKLDGMVFGDNPREGYFKESVFYHPEMQFTLRFPEGWKTRNQKQSVVGVSPNDDAAVQLSLAKEEDPESAARAFAGQEGLTAGRVERGNIHGHPAAAVEFEATLQQNQKLRGRAGYVRYRDLTFQLIGYTLDEKWSGYSGAIGSFITSFDRLTDRAALNVQPARVQIVGLDRPTSVEEFQRRHPSSVEPETVALINHVEPGGQIPAGKAKRVVGGELP